MVPGAEFFLSPCCLTAFLAIGFQSVRNIKKFDATLLDICRDV